MCENSQKHSIRVVGSYDLLTFFTEDVQKEFFDITTDPGFEKIFSHSDYKDENNDSHNFKYSPEEYEFELKMTNHGLIRESFWKDSFPPIFTIKPGGFSEIVNAELEIDNKKNNESVAKLIKDFIESLSNRCEKLDPSKVLEFCICRYTLSKLKEELENTGETEEYKIHLGLNSFGVANFGLTIHIDCNENDSFESLCKRIYEKGSWFQGDPLIDFKRDICNDNNNDNACIKKYFHHDSKNKAEKLKPRVFLSYF